MITRATLVTEGSSDIVLVPILQWLISEHTPVTVELRWADLRSGLRKPANLAQRLLWALDLYPCEILFVHRDADREDPEHRHREIALANTTGLPHVCVIPVRMQEAWLLHDESALREAAGRLHEALRLASGAKGRRAKQFSPSRAAHRLADLVEDWRPLRQLSAFQRLEQDTREALAALGLSMRG